MQNASLLHFFFEGKFATFCTCDNMSSSRNIRFFFLFVCLVGLSTALGKRKKVGNNFLGT